MNRRNENLTANVATGTPSKPTQNKRGLEPGKRAWIRGDYIRCSSSMASSPWPLVSFSPLRPGCEPRNPRQRSRQDSHHCPICLSIEGLRQTRLTGESPVKRGFVPVIFKLPPILESSFLSNTLCVNSLLSSMQSQARFSCDASQSSSPDSLDGTGGGCPTYLTPDQII